MEYNLFYPARFTRGLPLRYLFSPTTFLGGPVFCPLKRGFTHNREQPWASSVEEKRWVRVSSMCWRVDALILLLWLLGLVRPRHRLCVEERWGFFVLALVFGALATYASYLTVVLAKPEKVSGGGWFRG
jgi:heme A synthase